MIYADSCSTGVVVVYEAHAFFGLNVRKESSANDPGGCGACDYCRRFVRNFTFRRDTSGIQSVFNVLRFDHRACVSAYSWNVHFGHRNDVVGVWTLQLSANGYSEYYECLKTMRLRDVGLRSLVSGFARELVRVLMKAIGLR